MHPTSMDNMRKCLERYIARGFFTAKRRRIVEVGSYDVNGSYRAIDVLNSCEYCGVDMAPGPGVDLVLDDPYKLPFETATVDLVISGQMLEHSEYFWISFAEMIRVLTPDGYLVLIAPSAGPIHRHPVDCYRFYPDSYRALARLTSSYVVALWRDEKGPWKDLVGVFSKDPSVADIAQRPPMYYTQNTFPDAGEPGTVPGQGMESYLHSLQRIHTHLQPRRYLEIGVGNGKSMDLSSCPSIGIEPEPDPSYSPPQQCKLVPLSSDDFFESHLSEVKASSPDFVFIDGMRLFEFALRDFMYIERGAHPATCVMLNGIFPETSEQARRRRESYIWAGDVWKLVRCLASKRPDLHLVKLDSSPTGALVVLGLDPTNEVLWDQYNPIVSKHTKIEDSPPKTMVNRVGAVDPRHPAFVGLLEAVRDARDKPNVRQMVRKAFNTFRKGIGESGGLQEATASGERGWRTGWVGFINPARRRT